ncbi:membrane protein [Pseudomonas syringae pv. actinidiae ICMP 18804]|nr:membrane protein [Pseudomonas syringae pv. actinidiae ICMP 18804]
MVWTLMALALMIGGHMRANREIWLGGAALIGVVVIKLFFVELSNRGIFRTITAETCCQKSRRSTRPWPDCRA